MLEKPYAPYMESLRNTHPEGVKKNILYTEIKNFGKYNGNSTIFLNDNVLFRVVFTILIDFIHSK